MRSRPSHKRARPPAWRVAASGLAALATVALVIAAAPASAAVVRLHGGPTFSVESRLGRVQANLTPARLLVRDHGGPVLHSSAPYLVFWGGWNAFPPRWGPLLVHYLIDVAASSGANNTAGAVLHQYTDASGFANQRQTFSPALQTILDTQPYPLPGCSSLPSGVTSCVTADQIEAELTRLVAAHRLPIGDGANAPIYFVVLPPSVNACIQASNCASNQFCGYHSFIDTLSQPLLYAVIPSTTLAPHEDPKTCQSDGLSTLQEPNGTRADQLISTIAHEDAETITDPLMNAWYATSDVIEVADICASAGTPSPTNGTNPNAFLPVLGQTGPAGALFDQLINGDRYYAQSEWSNGAGECVMRPGPSPPRPAFSASAAGGTTVRFDPTATRVATGYSSVTWNFGDGTAPAFTPGAAPPRPVLHNYARAGAYTVTLTVVGATGNRVSESEVVDPGATTMGTVLRIVRHDVRHAGRRPRRHHRRRRS